MYIIIYIYICNLRWNVLHMLQDLSACSRSICSKLVPVAGDNTDSWCIFKSLAPSVCETCRTEWLNVTTATTGRGLLISMPWLWPALLTWLWSLAALTITEASSCRTSFTSSMHVEGDTPLHNAATGCCLLCPWHSLQPAAARLGGGVRTRSRVRRRLCGRTPLQTHHDISQPGHGPPFLLGSKSLDMAVLHSHRLTEASSCRSSFTSSMHVDGDTPLHNAATGCCLLCPWHSLQPAAARLGGGVRTRSRVRRRLCGRTPLQTHHDISQPGHGPPFLLGSKSLDMAVLHSHRLTEASSCRSSFTSSMHVDGDTALHNAATGCCLRCPWHSLQPAAARLGGGVRTRSRVRRRLCGRTPLQTHHDISQPGHGPPFLLGSKSLDMAVLHSHRLTEASSCRSSFTSSMHVDGDTALHNAATGCCLRCPWHSLQPAAARLGGGVRTRSRVRRRLCGRTPLQTHHDISQPGHGPHFLLGSKSLDMAVLHSHRLTEASSCRSSFTSSMHVDGDTALHNAAAGCYRRCLYSAACIPERPVSKSNLSVLPCYPCEWGVMCSSQASSSSWAKRQRVNGDKTNISEYHLLQQLSYLDGHSSDGSISLVGKPADRLLWCRNDTSSYIQHYPAMNNWALSDSIHLIFHHRN